MFVMYIILCTQYTNHGKEIHIESFSLLSQKINIMYFVIVI